MWSCVSSSEEQHFRNGLKVAVAVIRLTESLAKAYRSIQRVFDGSHSTAKLSGG